MNDTCTGCGACVSTCSKKALELKYNNEGFYYPHLDPNLCVQCKACEYICPELNDNIKEDIPYKEAYMIKAEDSEILYNSTSGGAFSIFADKVIKGGGIVFASRYNYESYLLEVANTDEYSIEEFRKSKYLESYVGVSFFKIKEELKNGRRVLFVGTPCEAKGLRRYIPKKYQDNLLIVDFVCHGVPSNKHHTEYRIWLEKKLKEKITYLDFRPKEFGWGPIFYHYKTSHKEKYIPGHNSYFYHAFQHSYFLRRSCYTCNRSIYSEADITIGDFWGIKQYNPDAKEKEGVSLCVCRSDKGSEFVNELNNGIDLITRIPRTAVEYIFTDHSDDNSFKYVSRESFYKKLIKHGYMGAVIRVYWKQMYMVRFKQLIKALIK